MKGFVFKLILLLVLTETTIAKQTLYVGALLELSNNWYDKYVKFFVHILEHAFEQIENRTDILADCSLTLITKDTQVML